MVTLILIVVNADTDEWGLVHFSRNKQQLERCIDDHDLFQFFEINDDRDQHHLKVRLYL